MVWMAGLDRASLGRVLDHIAFYWVASDREEMAEFLTRPEAIGASSSALRPVAENLVDHNPLAAMDWLSRLPGEARARETMWVAFRRWHRTQPEAAIAWLEDVPDAAGDRDKRLREVFTGQVDPETWPGPS